MTIYAINVPYLGVTKVINNVSVLNRV